MILRPCFYPQDIQAGLSTQPFQMPSTQVIQVIHTGFRPASHKPHSHFSLTDPQGAEYLLHYHNDKHSNEADAREQDSHHHQHSLRVVCHIVLPLRLHELLAAALAKEVLMAPASKQEHKLLSAGVLSGAKDTHTGSAPTATFRVSHGRPWRAPW